MRRLINKKIPPSAMRDPIENHTRYSKKTVKLLFITIIAITTMFLLGYYYEQSTTGFVPMGTTVNVTGTIPQNCDLLLEQGLNVISLNCISNFQARAQVLNSTNINSIDVIYDYRPESLDRWRVYNPNLPNWVVQDLTHFSRLRGYFFYMNNDDTGIYFEGTLANTSTIPLLTGMNLAGYPSKIVDTLPDALTTIQGSYTSIQTYNGTHWILFDGSINNTLTELEPGRGYLIVMQQNNNWIVQANRTQ